VESPDLVANQLLGTLDLIERKLAVVVGVEDAEDRVGRRRESLVEFGLAHPAIMVDVRRLKHRLYGIVGGCDGDIVELGGTQLAVLIRVR
jgi:hypothetical protein